MCKKEDTPKKNEKRKGKKKEGIVALSRMSKSLLRFEVAGVNEGPCKMRLTPRVELAELQ